MVSNGILARQYAYFTSKCYICLLDFISSTQSFLCSILLYPKDFEEFMSAYVFSYALSGLLAIKFILAKVHMSTKLSTMVSDKALQQNKTLNDYTIFKFLGRSTLYCTLVGIKVMYGLTLLCIQYFTLNIRKTFAK